MWLWYRIRDAVLLLFGRSEPLREVQRMRREWRLLELELDVHWEKVNALIARLSKRDSRKKAEPTEGPEPTAVPSKKAEIRQRIRSRRLAQLGQLEMPTNGTEETAE